MFELSRSQRLARIFQTQRGKNGLPQLPSRWGFALVFLWIGLFVADGRAATFTAALDRQTLSPGESAILTLTFQDGTPDELPSLPAVPNLSLRHTGQKSQFNFVNGRSSTQVFHEYLVTPALAGDYTIPAIRISVEGKALASQPLNLKVLPSGESTPDTALAGKTAFLKLVAEKNQVYLGEVLPVEIQLYARQGRLKQNPQLNQEGFTVGKLVQEQQRTTIFGNQYYNMVAYRTYVIPAKTGRLTLGPVSMPFIRDHAQFEYARCAGSRRMNTSCTCGRCA